MIDIVPSQSRLLSIFGWVGPGEKSRNRSSCDVKAAELRSMVVGVEQLALGGLARRVADHARAAADEHHRPTAGTLEVGQQEDLQQVARRAARWRWHRSRCRR